MKATKTIKDTERKQGKTTPIIKKEDVQENPDHRIDQDFPGFPHTPAKEEVINPKTPRQKKVADTDSHDD
jgi:hypothetical protein